MSLSFQTRVFLFFFSPCRTFRMGLDKVFNTNLQLNNAEGMKRNI